MDPPHIDGGVERRDVFLCILKDFLDRLQIDPEDTIREVTVPYGHRLGAEQVRLQIPPGKPLVGTAG